MSVGDSQHAIEHSIYKSAYLEPRANLMYMRAFAEAWPDEAIVQQAVGQLPGWHNLALGKLMSRVHRLFRMAKPRGRTMTATPRHTDTHPETHRCR
jgi:hypothetical protein